MPQYFTYIVVVSFIGGGNWSALKRPHNDFKVCCRNKYSRKMSEKEKSL
jgi:hypothetical protein